jgi:hypothetical protein
VTEGPWKFPVCPGIQICTGQFGRNWKIPRTKKGEGLRRPDGSNEMEMSVVVYDSFIYLPGFLIAPWTWYAINSVNEMNCTQSSALKD